MMTFDYSQKIASFYFRWSFARDENGGFINLCSKGNKS